MPARYYSVCAVRLLFVLVSHNPQLVDAHPVYLLYAETVAIHNDFVAVFRDTFQLTHDKATNRIVVLVIQINIEFFADIFDIGETIYQEASVWLSYNLLFIYLKLIRDLARD